MDGSSPKAILRPNGFCGCEECMADVSIMETHQIQIIEEDRLIGMLRDVETVQGMQHIKSDPI